MCFRHKGTVIGNQYGPGSGDILLDDVKCVGYETLLADCDHQAWTYHNCNHSQDVSVSCGTSPVQYGNTCLHISAGCTTGWVNYANELSQAALERSSQDAYNVIRLTRAARRLCGQ